MASSPRNALLTRRKFLAHAGAVAGLTLARRTPKQPSFLRQPNILLIIVDDLRPQLQCYGHRQMISPNIDALAAGGLLFERAYCQQALCAPSRASFLTGARPDTTGLYAINQTLQETRPDLTTLPQHFRSHGYKTIALGKVFHHDTRDDPTGWDVGPWRAFNSSQYYATEEARAQVALHQAAGGRAGQGPAFEAGDVQDDAYPDGQLTDRALAEMTLAANEPFFLAVGFRKPHLPFNAPKRYWDLYSPDNLSLTDHPFRPTGAPDIALQDWGELRGYYGIPPKGPLTDLLTLQLIHGYYACVSYIDAQVGRLMEGLRQRALDDHTIVVLLGDHGYQLGEQGLWAKHYNYETSVHAPLIVRDPQTVSLGARRTPALTEFIDLYPSLCELAGLPEPSHLEGQSFVPLLDQPNTPWKTTALSQRPFLGLEGDGSSFLRVMGYSIRTDRYRFNYWRSIKTPMDLGFELYDHDLDPHETTNIAYHPDNEVVVKILTQKLVTGFPLLQGLITDNEMESWPENGPLSPAFPNPFRQSTQFRVLLQQQQHVRIEVFDLQGRSVALLHDGMLQAGVPAWFLFEAGALPASTYLIRLTSPAFKATEQVILVR